MSKTSKISKILLFTSALLMALPAAIAQENPPPFKHLQMDGDDDDWFMEETTPKKPKPGKAVKIPDSQAANLGVPLTPDGRIIPLKDDDTQIMAPTSQLEVTNEYVIQPGAYYPGIPQYNVPYMGGLNPYYAPGVIPYGYNPGGININLGKAGGITLGGGGYPYNYGYPGYVPGTITPYGAPYVSPYMGSTGGPLINGGFSPAYGYPGSYAPGIGIPGLGVGGINRGGIGVPVVPGIKR